MFTKNFKYYCIMIKMIVRNFIINSFLVHVKLEKNQL